ncbi:MAG: SGNH/GDSL hydrolase family protein [Elusimicrobiales bacterium]|nr:SGNH/GDSL hydrolase family protein [Elusimicrobiales bacterium]
MPYSKTIKIFLINVISIAVIFLLLEVVSGFFLKKSYRNEIYSLIMQDKQLFWKHRKNVNLIFEGKEVSTNSYGFRNREISEKIKPRIIVMGASPSFGWGVKSDDTYSKLVENMFNGKYEVINASVIGYSSYQGILLVDKIINLKPDIIIFAYGANDADRYRFFDSTEVPDSLFRPRNILINSIIIKSNLTSLLNSFLTKKNILKYKFNVVPRVSIDEFKKNLELFHNKLKKNSIKMITLSIPFSYPLDNKNCNIDENLLKNANSVYPEEIKELKSCDFYADIKNYNDFFKKLQQLQIFKIKDEVNEYNKTIKSFAHETDIGYIDINSYFDCNKNLFLDPQKDMVHFSTAGHRKVAEYIYSYILSHPI